MSWEDEAHHSPLRPQDKYHAHTWKPEAIRSNPEAAFDVFDRSGNGYITVAELLFTTRKTNPSQSLYDEMKLFHKLDLDGDAIISKEEFCEVVRDKAAFPEEALRRLASLADETIPLSLMQGLRVRRSTRRLVSEKNDLVVTLSAVGLVHSKPFWGPRGAYVMIQETRSDVVEGTVVAWKPLRISVRGPGPLTVQVIDVQGELLGETQFDVGEPCTYDTAIGPLLALHPTTGVLAAKIIGTQSWIPSDVPLAEEKELTCFDLFTCSF